MSNLTSKSDAEKIVLEYIKEHSNKTASNFNPVILSLPEIAKNTNLNEKDVEKALDNLNNDPAQIERIQSNFEFWLPLNDDGKKIKESLFKLNVAHYNIFLFSFIFIILLYFIMKFAINNNYITITTNADYFGTGVIITGLSIWIARKLINKYFMISERIRNVKGYKIYVWLFIILTLLIIYLFNRGLKNELYFYISLGANFIVIITFIINALKKKDLLENKN